MSNKRISKVAGEFNIGTSTIMDFLNKKGFSIQNPNTKLTEDAYRLVEKEFKGDITLKKESEKMSLKSQRPKKETLTLENSGEEPKEKKKETEEEENFSSDEIRISNPSGSDIPIIPKIEKKKIAKKIFRENITPLEKPKIVGKIVLTPSAHPSHPSKEKEEKKQDTKQD
ncbi:MAG: translation initiation factor IF-2 N-terminal domain-containing protein, partial [Prolixibacteraceae bacterium]|nr:translation initiation factor IF-2 N-terminal domain-containing protein [Prolixibacteraceae bacterium]